jgi:hypothetical protein
MHLNNKYIVPTELFRAKRYLQKVPGAFLGAFLGLSDGDKVAAYGSVGVGTVTRSHAIASHILVSPI